VGVEGGAQEVKIDLMPPGVPKVSIFPLCCIFRAASCGRPQSLPSLVFLLEMKKELYNDISARRVLQTK
jgi:hypothetical protein